jgi:hypothetical protein
MALTKRGAVWWIDFVSQNGERIRESRLRLATEGSHKSCTISAEVHLAVYAHNVERHGHIRGTTDGFPRHTICNSLKKSNGSATKRMPTRRFFARAPRPAQVVESVRRRTDSRISGQRIDREEFFLTR